MADIISEKEEYRYILSTSASSGLVDGELLPSFLSSGLEMIDSHLQASAIKDTNNRGTELLNEFPVYYQCVHVLCQYLCLFVCVYVSVCSILKQLA